MNQEERKEIDGIKQEIALFQLNQMKKNAEFEKAILEPYLQGFETRIKILEEARQRQISLNGEYDKRMDELEKSKGTIDKPKFRWW